MYLPCLVFVWMVPRNGDMGRAFLRPGRAILRPGVCVGQALHDDGR
jgi:hypothetical protein